MTRAWLVALLAMCPTLAAAQGTITPPFFALEITNIGPVADGRSTVNRIYWAYPAFEYNIRAAVVGGVYPFTYSLSNAPSGMTINASTGEISWPNPTTDALNIVLTVTDSATPTPATDTATWSIDVDATRFKFIDAVNGVNASNNGCGGGCGTGAIGTPWREFMDVMLNDAVADILYFRTGVYYTEDGSTHASVFAVGSAEQGIWFSDNSADTTRRGTTIWLAYPEESPIIDMGGDQTTLVDGWGVRMTGQDVYLDGLEVRNLSCLAFQFEPDASLRGATVRRMNFHDLGPGNNGSNCAFIDTRRAPPNAAYGMVVQDNVFDDLNIDSYDDAVAIKVYSQDRLLIEDNVFNDGWGVLHLKHDCRRFTVRHNTLLVPGVGAVGIGGNMDRCEPGAGCDGATQTSYGEITFNNIRIPDTDYDHDAMDINQAGVNHITHIYRNTIHGNFRFRNVTTAGNTYGPGPFYVSRNVIINSGGNCTGTGFGFYMCDTTTNASTFARITRSNNLETSSEVVDANGDLIEPWLTTDGPDSATPKGHMTGDVEEPPVTPPGSQRYHVRPRGAGMDLLRSPFALVWRTGFVGLN